MGCRFELVLAGTDAPTLRAAGDRALDEIASLHDRLSAFDPVSTLSRINREAHTAPIAVAGDLFDLLALAHRVWAESAGAFDPTIGPLMRLWGLRGESPNCPPDHAALDAARARVGFAHVDLDAASCSVRLARPGMQLDLGAIAKGHAIDVALAILRDAGVPAALIHAGTSSVGAIGAPPGLQAWHVRVRPRAPGPTLGVRLRDACLGVSEPGGRVAHVGSRDVGHVIDPRSGVPVESAGAALVVARSGALADAWSTALLVLARRPTTLDAASDGPATGPTTSTTTSAVLARGAWTIDDPRGCIDVDAPADSHTTPPPLGGST
ncbi:MAG: FAD:protein FMN transferase [Planctomycetota bacterium]|nr:FAD:protein FMN transferase [Planctomycetota bacterium]